MADHLKPAPAPPRAGRGYALSVVLAGALLAFCAVLPWAGVEARSAVIGGAISSDVRGIDDAAGLWTLAAGLAVLAAGVAGLLSRPRVAALAALPAVLAAVLLVRFAAAPRQIGDRLSLDLGGLLSVQPVIRIGWYAALATAVAAVVLSVLALTRRARRS
ncbi:hypothetical protein [Nonomuraea pusilla]|uniref:Tryptophan-associated transmembrane protein (Trp_oprn_chp) n=1 Tax=Nonomuraea pusilla TaxID=46177 RepID=A0A1H7SBK3_9ACTN|nr:hypothetical protein [Nonomuraea pusilla]SEL70000.1 hypothetical protein SAMN05660976_03136 [Nonomuraea pusilla]